MKKLKAVILAGGAGTRLRPLTCDMPKPLVPICGSPCIYYILNLLKTHGIEESCITLHYRGEDIEKAVSNVHEMSLRPIKEELPLGTAGSIAGCKDFIDGDFCVICGDCICDFDLTKAAEFHRSHGNIATVLLTRVKDPLEYGVAVTDEAGTVSRFIEKPSWSRAYSDTVNTGIYFFSKEIFDYIPTDKPSDVAKDIFPALMKKGIKIHGYITDGYWCDVGNLSAYMRCNKDVLEGKLKITPKLSVLTKNIDTAKINNQIFTGEGSVTEELSVTGFAVIGKNCCLGKNVRLENSILMDGVVMEDGSSSRGAVICTGAILKKNVSVGENSIVGSGSEIGANVIVSAGSKIYPKNVIPEYTFIKSSVVNGIDSMTVENGKVCFKGNRTDTALFVKTGSALSSTLKRDVAVGVDRSCNTKTLKAPTLALFSGIIASATNAFDLGECDFNAFCDAVREYGFGGGVFLGEEKGNVTLTLIEKDGLPFGRESERKFESEFSSEETETSDIGEIRPFKGFEKIYEKRIVERLNEKAAIRSFVSAPKFITEKLSIRPNKENSEYIYVMPNRLIIQTKNREAYGDDLIKCVTAFCCGMIEGVVFIPYNYPTAVDSAAKKYGFRCERLTLEDKERVNLSKMTDTYSRAVYLLSYMAEHGLSFAEIARDMPVFTSRRREIEVSSDKAAVMRVLSSGKDRELVEGVKIKEKTGTVLIVPQKTKNAFSICAESADAETAAELCDFYAKKLKK